MRALVIGDIHTEDELLATTLAFGAREGAGTVISVGDIVDGPGDPLACIAQLDAAGAIVVAGNHERWVAQGHPFEPFDYPDDALAWIRALPATRELVTPSGLLLLGHGIADNDMARLEPDTTGYALECLTPLWKVIAHGRHRWLLGGHTHVPMVRTFDGPPPLTVVNPGTLSRRNDPGFMIADFARGAISYYELPLPSGTPRLGARYSVAVTTA